MGRIGPQTNETIARGKGDEHHEQQTGKDLANRKQPKRIDVIDIKQHACRSTREAPKACARQRGEHAYERLARFATIQAIAPSAALPTRCRIGSCRYRLLLCLPCRHAHVHTPLCPYRSFFVRQKAQAPRRTRITLLHNTPQAGVRPAPNFNVFAGTALK